MPLNLALLQSSPPAHVACPRRQEDDVWVEPHEARAVAVAPGALLRVMESDLSQRQVRACAGPTGGGRVVAC